MNDKQRIEFYVETDDTEGFKRHPNGTVYRCRATEVGDSTRWGYGDTALEAISDYCQDYDTEEWSTDSGDYEHE